MRTQPAPKKPWVPTLSDILALKYQVSVCHVINKIVVEEGTVGGGSSNEPMRRAKTVTRLKLHMTREPTYRAFPSRNRLTPEGAEDRRDSTVLTSTCDNEHN
jgi:hypothetical protein